MWKLLVFMFWILVGENSFGLLPAESGDKKNNPESTTLGQALSQREKAFGDYDPAVRTGAVGSRPGSHILDHAGLFSKEAVQKANAINQKMIARHKLCLIIESFQAIPMEDEEKFKGWDEEMRRRYYDTWCKKQLNEISVDGVYVLICVSTRTIHAFISKNARPKFRPRDQRDLVGLIIAQFRKGQMDKGLLESLDFAEAKFALDRQWRSRSALIRAANAFPRLVIQMGHTQGIFSAKLSADGKRVLTASSDFTARLWDTGTGRELRTFVGHEGVVTSAVFSADGNRVLTGSFDGTARLWDIESGEELGRFEGHTDWVYSAVFSADDNRVLTCSLDRTARLWDANSGLELQCFEGHLGGVRSATFSADGKRVLTASAQPDVKRKAPPVGHPMPPDDNTARLWDADTGKELRRFKGHTRWITSALFSPDGKRVLTSSWDKSARLWDAATGKELLRLEGHKQPLESAVFSGDGKFVLTGSLDKTARLWDADTGKELRSLEGHGSAVRSAVFSADGKLVLTGAGRIMGMGQMDFDHTARLWNADTGKELRRFEGLTSLIGAATFSRDGKLIAIAADKSVFLWDVENGRELRRIAVLKKEKGGIPSASTGISGEVYLSRVGSVTFSADGKRILTGASDDAARLWEIETGKELRSYHGKESMFGSATFSPDEKRIVTSGSATILWDTNSGKEVLRFGASRFATFSGDGKRVLTSLWGNSATLWDGATGMELRRFDGHTSGLESAEFSPDGKRVLTAAWDNTSRLWDTDTGRELRLFEGHSNRICSAVFSPDSRRVLTASADQTARLWDTETGQEIRRFEGHTHWVLCALFSPDGKRVLTSSLDNTSRLWDIESGKEVCKLISFRDGSWTVFAPDGRFDTSDLDEIKGMHWIMPDEPLTPLSPEIFMRDYYEPRLLSRILSGERFEPIRSLASVNRVQPKVEIVKIEPQPETVDEIIVTVTVTGQSRKIGKTVFHSGAEDLQFFRDGQLVASFPQIEGPITLDAKSNSNTVSFPHIRLPRLAGKKEVEFTAYAFNSDRVKSATAKVRYAIPADLTPRPRTAYIVAIGVNSFEKARNLSFAVPDAKAFAETMQKTLLSQKQFDRVVVVSLLADASRKKHLATRANIATVLRILAGGKADASLVKQVPDVKELAAARPEDLLLISFSTHGYNSTDGKFHLLPADDGKHTISTDDLSLWLRDVDAGEMVMIVDACHSAGAVEEKGFKPGPMGSRGFGQLAYNKRMRILAASQASDVAYEVAGIGHGLLTYAMVHNGMKEGQADFSPVDKRIMLAEWLNFGVRRVPQLAEEIAAGKLRAVSDRDLRVEGAERGFIFRRGRKSITQQPSLFDFTRGVDGILLAPVE